MDNFSFAGPDSGLTNPEDIDVFTIDEAENKRLERAAPSSKSLVVQWSGGEYSRRLTWITASEESVLELEELR